MAVWFSRLALARLRDDVQTALLQDSDTLLVTWYLQPLTELVQGKKYTGPLHLGLKTKDEKTWFPQFSHQIVWEDEPILRTIPANWFIRCPFDVSIWSTAQDTVVTLDRQPLTRRASYPIFRQTHIRNIFMRSLSTNPSQVMSIPTFYHMVYPRTNNLSMRIPDLRFTIYSLLVEYCKAIMWWSWVINYFSSPSCPLRPLFKPIQIDPGPQKNI